MKIALFVTASVLALGCAGAHLPAEVAPSTGLAEAGQCAETASVALQVLGSGGPIPDDERASSGYVVWVDGKSRLLVDAGGGVFHRFGEAGASLEELDAIALTHLHADHSADLAALLKGGYFAPRRRPLPLVGPSGNEAFPPLDEFIEGLLSGPYRYLNGYLSGARGWFDLPATVVDVTRRQPEPVPFDSELRLTAVGVTHGRIPAVGYLVEVRGKKIGFAGDQSADNPEFVAMVTGADVLVVHHPIPESAQNLRSLHATPSELGAIAAAAAPKMLVLSHHMQRALRDLDASLGRIQDEYAGRVIVASDLHCVPVR